MLIARSCALLLLLLLLRRPAANYSGRQARGDNYMHTYARTYIHKMGLASPPQPAFALVSLFTCFACRPVALAVCLRCASLPLASAQPTNNHHHHHHQHALKGVHMARRRKAAEATVLARVSVVDGPSDLQLNSMEPVVRRGSMVQHDLL